MGSYSLDLRERVVKAHLEEGQNKSAVARRFGVSRWTVERYIKRPAMGSLGLTPHPGRGRRLDESGSEVLRAQVQAHHDWTLEAAEHGQVHPQVVTSLKRRIASLVAEKEALENELELETKRSNEHELSLLTSIPGIGVRTACLLLAELGSVRRFATARTLVAFVGLTPTQFTSGTSVAQPSHISRLGSAYLRHILYMPCLCAIRFNPVIKGFFERVVAHGKHKKAAVVACMAKMLKIVFGVLTHQKPFQPIQPQA